MRAARHRGECASTNLSNKASRRCRGRRRGVRPARCSCRCPERQDHLDGGKLKSLEDSQRIDEVTAEAACVSHFWAISYIAVVFGVIHFCLRGSVSTKARLDSCTIRWSSSSNANLSSAVCASRRRLEVAENSSCSSLNRFDGLTSERLWVGA